MYIICYTDLPIQWLRTVGFVSGEPLLSAGTVTAIFLWFMNAPVVLLWFMNVVSEHSYAAIIRIYFSLSLNGSFFP